MPKPKLTLDHFVRRGHDQPAVIRVGPGADQGRIKQLWEALKRLINERKIALVKIIK